MTQVQPKFKKTGQAAPGFSLIELMMAVALVGILANLAMMAFGGVAQDAEFQKDKRNAQEIATLAATANAAGASFIVAGDERATIVNLRVGVSPTSGAFRGQIFRIPGVSDNEITGAMKFLTLNDTDLVYSQNGSSGP
jgi:prepilin-type N-terminal cleavage/methylation domain-containing protein